MKLEYDGFLHKDVAKQIYIAAQKYNYVLELSSLPSSWSWWLEKNLIDYEISEQGCCGKYDIRKIKMYKIIKKGTEDDKALFLFLKSDQEYRKFIFDYTAYIRKKSPFKTIIG